MFKNYLFSTIRTISKNKVHSTLNLLGLAIGIACAGLIFLWVKDEWQFDSFHQKKNLIYVVKVNNKTDAGKAGTFTHSSTPGPLGAALKAQYPIVADYSRVTSTIASQFVRIGERAVYAGGMYADPSLLHMFTFHFIEGSAGSAFDQLHSLVITKQTAKKFFGRESEVLGRTVRFDDKQDYVVTGVVEDMPENSTLQFEWLAPFQVFYNQYESTVNNWNHFGLTTYIELKPGTNPEAMNRILADPYYDFTMGKKDVSTSTAHIFLFPMSDWHLRDQFEEGVPTGGGRIQYVKLFSTIAWIILFIACINFMNLATARSEKRAREVGVRKVLGAVKNNLVGQFIGEAWIMSLVAAGASLLMMAAALPLFNLLVQKHLSLGLYNPYHWAALLTLATICGLVAGSYPAFYLSSFSPIFVFKGIRVKTGMAEWIRKALVVTQFVVSIVLIIGTIIIYQQIQHIKNRDLGFSRDHLVQIGLQGDMLKNFQAIKQQFIASGSVQNVALADHETIEGGNNTSSIYWQGKDPNSQIVISQRLVSPEFITTMGMHVDEGRDFESTDVVEMNAQGGTVDSTQTIHVLITASLADLMGKGSAVGKTMNFRSIRGNFHLEVVGVIRNYVYGDIYGKHADPVMFYCLPAASSLMYIRTAAQVDPQAALNRIESILKKLNPGYPFEYRFVDDQFAAKFFAETLVSRLSRVFAGLAIFISCLGLFGLASFMAERRTKEIGIRKVLGASASGITRMLSSDFLKLVLAACAIGFPIAWIIMNKWLQDYPYRIQIQWWVFVIGGTLAVLIAFVTVSFQSIKAALANPIKSLRVE